MKDNKQIDFTKWTTQQQLADELGVSIQRVQTWIQRNQIEWHKFPQLNNQRLVKKGSVNIKTIR